MTDKKAMTPKDAYALGKTIANQHTIDIGIEATKQHKLGGCKHCH